jgi:hypothetical protein
MIMELFFAKNSKKTGNLRRMPIITSYFIPPSINSRLSGLAFIAVIAFNILLMTGCPDPNGEDAYYPTYYTFTSIEGLETWLKNQPKYAPYFIKLNGVSDIDGLGTVLKENDAKFIYLDLSGSPAITAIPANAFSNCDYLFGIIMPNGVTTIKSNAFSNCVSLTIVNIPNAVTTIENYAFYQCFGLTSVYIPNGVTSIKSNAFYMCFNLANVFIPNSVTSIGSYAFYQCASLASVTFQGTIPEYDFNPNSPFPGDLRSKYLAGGIGTYTRPDTTSTTWTKK